MSHLLDEMLAQAANGSPATVALSAESVAVLLFASEFLGFRPNWLDKGLDPLDEVTDADWDEIEKLVAEVYDSLMTPLIGTIFPVMLATIPDNMLLCDGTSQLRVDYPLLYAALDSAFIVDADHFVTPDLRGRTVIGAGTGSGLSTYAVGATGGQQTHVLSVAELATHGHAVTDPGHSHTITDPGHTHGTTVSPTSPVSNRALVSAGGAQTVNPSGVTGSNTTGISNVASNTGITIGTAGTNTAHNNLQPYLALNYAVVAL